MKILFLIISLISLCAMGDIRTDLHKQVSEKHHPITYLQANQFIFTQLFNQNNMVCSVYSPNFCINTSTIPSAKIMNIEHTWPQSEGANGIGKSDLHHLFPTSSSTNSIRSSLPFCNVNIVKWESDQSKRGLNIFGEHCFEPPKKHQGNVARAMFYFSIRYDFKIDDHQELFFREWDKTDPVDFEELERNKTIQSIQNNSNPFIENPNLVNSISDF